jgi:hypothetical protein
MTAVADVLPVDDLPFGVRPRHGADARVVMLYPPSERSVAPPLRLTRRGVAVLAAAVALVCAAFVLVAWRSAPPTGPAQIGPRVVTVRPGDTLWSIASHAAPQTDPRVEVDRLERLNGLSGAMLVPGQTLRIR